MSSILEMKRLRHLTLSPSHLILDSCRGLVDGPLNIRAEYILFDLLRNVDHGEKLSGYTAAIGCFQIQTARALIRALHSG